MARVGTSYALHYNVDGPGFYPTSSIIFSVSMSVFFLFPLSHQGWIFYWKIKEIPGLKRNTLDI